MNPAGIDKSQPPPDPPANTERTCSVHFDDMTDGEDTPVADGGPDDPDPNNLDDNGDNDTDWTAIYVMEQQADMLYYVVTEADRHLDKVYRDHPHSNAEKHLAGGIETNSGKIVG